MGRLCIVDGCDRRVRQKSLCFKHYWEQRERVPCSFSGCPLPALTAGYCNTHYLRKQRRGDVSYEPVRNRYDVGAVCSFEGCDEKPKGHGFCATHWARWRKHGDPLVVLVPFHVPKEIVTYSGAHHRVRSAKGPASAQWCDHCDNRASEWAYDHEDPDERTQTVSFKGRAVTAAYSLDPKHYLPLCHSCHTRFDLHHSTRKAVA